MNKKDMQDFLDKNIYVKADVLIANLLFQNQRNFQLEDQLWYRDLFCKYAVYNPPPYTDMEFVIKNPDILDQELIPREAYQFWIISDLLAQSFKKQNQLLTNQWGFWIWGREAYDELTIHDEAFQNAWKEQENQL